MSWRNQGITGSNNIPLGKRRFGGDDEEPEAYSNGNGNGELKRGRSPEPRTDADGPRRRKKRNRWGDASENKAAGLMGLTTAITANMTGEQLEAYTLHLRITEISQKLRIDDVVPADGDRSPSPPPQYDNHGRRINTREYRYRKRLEDERHKLIEKAMKTIPNYHPPQDYRRPTKTQEKVYVPVNDYPEINFIGLLIGPRGNTLKKMETESGAKIAIRGKGSVKEGKGRSDAAHASNQEEDLHCLIMADTEEKVNKAKKLIHNIIETAASIPEGQNELKRNQPARTAVKSATASTTAPRDKTTLPASFAVSVATQDTWPEIVPTARRVPAGVTMAAPPVADLPVVLEAEMPSTASTSNSCKNSAAVPPAVPLLRASRPALARTITAPAATRSPGNVVPLVVLLPGAAVTTTRETIVTATVVVAAAAALLLGLVTVAAAVMNTVETAATATTARATVASPLVPLPVPPLGINLLERRTTAMVVATAATLDTVPLLA
ncbi:hypothetical protein K456DRAFT_1488703 [Colletotrichum gloeosporioides 23]|nr:hypothetical protein K456DRAFT_1488703 [Colletotrichum gloeosporioides 23]